MKWVVVITVGMVALVGAVVTVLITRPDRSSGNTHVQYDQIVVTRGGQPCPQLTHC